MCVPLCWLPLAKVVGWLDPVSVGWLGGWLVGLEVGPLRADKRVR